jgi:DNA polymerase-3 subunit delta
MSSGAQRALKRAMQDGSFEPVYYFHGEDDFLKDEATRRLVERAIDPATRDFNLELRRGGDLTAETLDALLGTPPMMAERRVVVVRDVGALKKDARAALDRYLKRPAPDAVVVLVTVGPGAKPDKALLEMTSAVAFDLLTPEQVPKWITQRAAELGASIAWPAALLLQEAVGNDLPQLHSELDKLVSYRRGGEIDETAVADVVGIRRGETLGDLLDRVALRDAAGALAIVPHVLAQPKTTAVSVVMALSTQMLALAWGKALRDRGTAAGRLEGEFFGLLKESSSSYTGRPWGEAARAWARAVDRWSAPALDRALGALLAADCALKESRLSSDEQVLSSLVLALCVDDALGAAA